MSCVQVLQPWRRVFRDAFAHDKASGGLYCLRAADAGGRHATVSRLSVRCSEQIPDFEASLPLLCQGLELPEWAVPAPPPLAMVPPLQPLPAYQVPTTEALLEYMPRVYGVIRNPEQPNVAYVKGLCDM